MNRPTAQQYRNAARAMERGLFKFCCHALKNEGASCRQLMTVYKADIDAAWVALGQRSASSAWMFAPDAGDSTDFRILALCFMAAACKDLPHG